MSVPRLSILLLVLLLLPAATGLAGNAESDYRRAKEGYRQLLNSSKKQLYRHNWQKVIDRFLAVEKTYPGHRRAPDALYMAGKASEGLQRVSGLDDDARQAVRFYDRLVAKYADDSLADDALFLGGKLLEDVLKDRGAAYERFSRIVERYPGGDMAARARSRLGALARYAPAKKSQARSPSPAAAARKGGPTELRSIRFWSKPDYTRVVLDLDKEAEFSANLLAADAAEGVGPRLYVDVLGARPASGLEDSTPVDDGLLQKIRTGRPDSGRVRVVLDLVSFQDYKVFSLPDPFRIVIDVAGSGAPQLKGNRPEIHLPPAGGGGGDGVARVLDQVPAEAPLKLHLPPNGKRKGLRRIVVDAGHGGKDPGAIGPSGVQEKEVALAMARALARRLEKELGCEVVLTRDRDVFIPLEERTAIANKVGADLFISIHANASRSRKAYGVETYYLNFSKNDKAIAVAARENGTSLKEVGDLELILFDLMANAKINESSRLAAEIQKSLVLDLDRHYSHIRDLGVRQGPFYVLLGATMPSVLVETAFISNSREESRLTNRKFQDRTVTAITRGVSNYAAALKLIATK